MKTTGWRRCTLSALARRVFNCVAAGEQGYALVSILVLLAFGGLLLPPLLSLVSTSQLLENIHESSLQEFYAADAGIEDALWQIKADELTTLFPGYDLYDFQTEYSYSDYPDSANAPQLNNKQVDVTIQNIWIPRGIDPPTTSGAQQRIDDAVLVVTGGATDADTYRVRIAYDYQKASDDDWDELLIEEIGIWIPPGFAYEEGTSNLEDDRFADYYCVPDTEAYKSGQAVTWTFSPPVAFLELPGVDTDDYPLVAAVTFDFASVGGGRPEAALSWISTTGVPDVDYAWDADVRVFRLQSMATDPIEGTVTTIDAYTVKGEIRRISSAIPGDYFATGNSLLTSTDYNDDYRNRLFKESEASIATDETGENGIPSQGIPEAAFLYWTGWIDWHDYDPQPLFYDDCSNMGNWSHSSLWSQSSGRFRGRGSSTAAADRRMSLNHSVDLSGCEPGTVTISWDQSEYQSSGNLASTEGLFYAFSADGGASWSSDYVAFLDDNPPRSFSATIPEQYLVEDFRVLFHFNFNRSAEYVYLDDITIAGPAMSLRYPEDPTSEKLTALIADAARTNVVMFGAEDSEAIQVTADSWQIEPTTGTAWEDTWSYCCFADVTERVRGWITDGYLENNATGTYTFGHRVAPNEADPGFSRTLYVRNGPNESTGYPLGTPAPYPDSRSSLRYQYSHAGWSLIVIYTSPTTHGHQLYLYDIQDPGFEFTEAWEPSGYPNPDFDGDGSPGGRISGFLVPDRIEGEAVAAKMTVFVGEGDSLISGDRAQMNGVNLSNSASPATNVWNSESPNMSVDGVDIDTFVIEWDDDILETGDSSADIDLPTRDDGFNLVYIILSFRSETTAGGTISFLVSG